MSHPPHRGSARVSLKRLSRRTGGQGGAEHKRGAIARSVINPSSLLPSSIAPSRAAALVLVAAGQGCGQTIAATDWTCDFDASESRPLSNPDATPGPDGALPAAVCQNTCGSPATSCTLTILDGGEPGAVCPVCTF